MVNGSETVQPATGDPYLKTQRTKLNGTSGASNIYNMNYNWHICMDAAIIVLNVYGFLFFQ